MKTLSVYFWRKKLIFLLFLPVLLSLLIYSCSTGSDGGTTAPIIINSNIITNGDFVIVLPEDTVTNHPLGEVKANLYYNLGENYDPSRVFVIPLGGVDVGNLGLNDVNIDFDPDRKIISGTINLSSKLDYEMPRDTDRDNVYELIKFLVTNVDGGSNAFSLLLKISNIIGSYAFSTRDFVFTNAENQTGDHSLDIDLTSFYAVDSATDVYNDNDVFITVLGGDDVTAVDTNGLIINVDNRRVNGNINYSIRDYESPIDNDGNNLYELIRFELSNVQGQMGTFSILKQITNVDENIYVDEDIVISLPENFITNHPFSINIRDFFYDNNDYGDDIYVVIHQDGVDVNNLRMSGVVTVGLMSNFDINGEINGEINLSNDVDFEMPTDENGDNIYELANFVITNIYGGSNLISLHLSVQNNDRFILFSNQVTLERRLYTSNVIADLTSYVELADNPYTYSLTGADKLAFELEGDSLITTNGYGFKNWGTTYSVLVSYHAGSMTTGLRMTVNVPMEEWVEVTNSVPWTRYQDLPIDRYWFQAETINNSDILILGGFLGNSVNDVWLSQDRGYNWSLVTNAAPWRGRYAFQTVVLANDDIVLMGGDFPPANDVWLSQDRGYNWSLVTNAAPWSARTSFQTVVLANDDIVLMGGVEGNSRFNDVWLSSNRGLNWGRVTTAAPWSARYRFQAVVLTNDDILLMGGYDDDRKNDIWKSSDGGTNWSQVTTAAPWSAREEFQVVVLNNNDIVLMGGSGNAILFNDVWLSTDEGESWTNIHNAPWKVRHSFQEVVVDGRVFIMGGEDNTTGIHVGVLSDVWSLSLINTNFW